ncbi:unnamed protein product [Blepharisma stoltei]|uniref:RING-type domain-containing protein n=1 Tax=Blepharisma stoltei TaxID=1481888 RepID=A0AAU9JS46_9CILI|nr:unnamed protein product [Blepharisma stoltei]
MLGYSMKSYLCHNCHKSSLLDTSNLICPHCGNDFLEEEATARAIQRQRASHENQQTYEYVRYYCYTCKETSLINPHHMVCPKCQGTILEEASSVRPINKPEFRIPEEPRFEQPHDDPHDHRYRQHNRRQPNHGSNRRDRQREESPFSAFFDSPFWENGVFRDFERDPFEAFEPFFNGNHFGRRQERVLGRLFGDLSINPIEYLNQQLGSFDDIINQLSRRNGQQTHPASEESINRLKKRIVQRGEEIQKCSVCMDDIAEGTEANVLSCSHAFHPDCIQPWLRVKNTCPVCRKEVR